MKLWIHADINELKFYKERNIYIVLKYLSTMQLQKEKQELYNGEDSQAFIKQSDYNHFDKFNKLKSCLQANSLQLEERSVTSLLFLLKM